MSLLGSNLLLPSPSTMMPSLLLVVRDCEELAGYSGGCWGFLCDTKADSEDRYVYFSVHRLMLHYVNTLVKKALMAR